jgi:hypothetical protein
MNGSRFNDFNPTRNPWNPELSHLAVHLLIYAFSSLRCFFVEFSMMMRKKDENTPQKQSENSRKRIHKSRFPTPESVLQFLGLKLVQTLKNLI